MNKVFLYGYLGHDPETRQTNKGDTVATFSVATSEKWDGGEHTEWHRCVAFGRQAEVITEYLRKGSPVIVEGRIRTENWETKEGEKRSTNKVYVYHVTFCGGGRDQQDAKPRREPPAPQQEQKPLDDEIPF